MAGGQVGLEKVRHLPSSDTGETSHADILYSNYPDIYTVGRSTLKTVNRGTARLWVMVAQLVLVDSCIYLQ